MRALSVYLNQRRIGALQEDNDVWTFRYEDDWVAMSEGFDLSPALPRGPDPIVDGASDRPVQWYFDNLLPEENLRVVAQRDAGLHGDDAFALLAYLGAESAGSLVLAPWDRGPAREGGLQLLTVDALSQRIRQLPRVALHHGAPKRMSLAGAQHKLLVVVRDEMLLEPFGNEPSTHILKPDHPDADYPASVINEFIVMRLARILGLAVPPVRRVYVPEPVYIVERFDRVRDTAGFTTRRHIIDACQLLNKARSFKYIGAGLATLAQIASRCTNPLATRQRIFQWVLFNVLIGNGDNHLKNLSFHVDEQGIALAEFYDLLCTAAYHTKAFAHERFDWPSTGLTVELPGAPSFDKITHAAVLRAAIELGAGEPYASREIARMTTRIGPELDRLSDEIAAENEVAPEAVRRFLAVERRLIDVVRKIVVPEMCTRLRRVS